MAFLALRQSASAKGAGTSNGRGLIHEPGIPFALFYCEDVMKRERTLPPLCACGCGERVKISKYTWAKYGWKKGEPRKYVNGHHNQKGEKSLNWKGGIKLHSQGYILVYHPNHPRSYKGYVFEHILIAESALGKYLPFKAKIHHINEIRKDNCKENLVICQDTAYHLLLHRRTKAVRAGFPAYYRKCIYCGLYEDPDNMGSNQTSYYHRNCFNINRKKYRNKS